MPKVAGKDGKKVKYVRLTISIPESEFDFVKDVVDLNGSDRSKVIARIIKERRTRSSKRLLGK